MSPKRLTAAAVDKIRPPNKGRDEHADAIVKGLWLRVSFTAKKAWTLHYRVAGEGGVNANGQQLRGKLRRMTLGTYPQVDLAQAREAARRALELADAGIDPVQHRKDGIAETRRAADNTVAAVVDDFMRRYREPRNSPQTVREARSVFDRLVLPDWGDRPISSISRRDVIVLLDRIGDQNRPHAPNKALAELRRLFNWAMERGMLEVSPAVGIKMPTKEVARDRVLSDQELSAVWAAASAMGYPVGPLVQLLILTAQRRDEVATMQWQHLDLEAALWRLPREATKADRAHEVPLAPQVVELFEGLPRFQGPHVFTTTGGAKAVSGFSKWKRKLDELSGVSGWRLHDLRRTAASGMARLGTPPHILSAVLNHAPATTMGVTAIYNRYGYQDEMRQALEAWAAHVQMVVNGNK
jgi:integrase